MLTLRLPPPKAPSMHKAVHLLDYRGIICMSYFLSFFLVRGIASDPQDSLFVLAAIACYSICYKRAFKRGLYLFSDC